MATHQNSSGQNADAPRSSVLVIGPLCAMGFVPTAPRTSRQASNRKAFPIIIGIILVSSFTLGGQSLRQLLKRPCVANRLIHPLQPGIVRRMRQ